MKYLTRIGDAEREYTFERRGDILVATCGDMVAEIDVAQVGDGDGCMSCMLGSFFVRSARMSRAHGLQPERDRPLDLTCGCPVTGHELSGGFARQGFNDAVMAYNSYRQSFPPVVFASTFGHPADAQLLEFDDSAQIQAAPKVSF